MAYPLTVPDIYNPAKPASVTTSAGPWAVLAGDTWQFQVQTFGARTATLTAANAQTPASGTAIGGNNLSGLTVIYQADKDQAQATFTFLAGDFAVPATPTVAEVCNAFNTRNSGNSRCIPAAGSKVQFESNTAGNNSTFNLVGGTALAAGALNMTAGLATSTGNSCADATKLQPAELSALLVAVGPELITAVGATTVQLIAPPGLTLAVTASNGSAATGIAAGVKNPTPQGTKRLGFLAGVGPVLF